MDLIMKDGFNYEGKINEYHWATNSVQYLIDCLKDKKEFLVTFIPHEWVQKLEEVGLIVRNAWRDYFKYNLNEIEPLDNFEFLTIEECEEASKVTMMCKNQSRGFTGQTSKWMKVWISNTEISGSNTGTRNNGVIIERGINNEIIGVICVATYGHEIEKGPILWIREIAVIPKFQNNGIGRKLILRALAYGKKHNAARAFLAADECNYPGIHLYTDIGFVPSEEKSQIDMIKREN
ncbi:MAG: GNAT family N-acetyltransferase [Clostridium sp.]|nr:GNAT family N-acetyltransferase [Clostridium sp.]